MATSSRQSALFGLQDWKRFYQTYRQADFSSYDYETLRKSFIDYLTIYYPETFNDYIESSEFVALLDVMAFMGQGLAFRDDLNTRENFIDTAERRDSVIKLANLVSYTPKRNLEAQGYLKVTSVRTTQNIIDLNGFNLGNVPVLWNDPANPNWLEQYNTIINAALINTQRVGLPANTAQITPAAPTPAPTAGAPEAEPSGVEQALIKLGYSPQQAAISAKKVPPGMSEQDAIKLALSGKLRESLTWSRGFDPGRILYNKMKSQQ